MRQYGPKPATIVRVPMEITRVLEPEDHCPAELYDRRDMRRVYYLESARMIKTPEGKRLWARWRTK